MSTIADAYRKMVAAGMSTDDIADMLEILEAGFSRPVVVGDANAERRREKDRERKRVRRIPQNSADSAESADAPPPSPSSGLSPRPPIQTPTPSSPPIVPPPSQNASLAEQLWALQPPKHRRSTRPDVRKALDGVVRRGADPADLLRALTAYYAHPDRREDEGRYAKGAASLLMLDRWRDFLPRPEPPQIVNADVLAKRHQHFAETGEWRETWGPRPEKAA